MLDKNFVTVGKIDSWMKTLKDVREEDTIPYREKWMGNPFISNVIPDYDRSHVSCVLLCCYTACESFLYWMSEKQSRLLHWQWPSGPVGALSNSFRLCGILHCRIQTETYWRKAPTMFGDWDDLVLRGGETAMFLFNNVWVMHAQRESLAVQVGHVSES